MNGPEHYKRAEELLGGRHNGGATGARSPEEAIALAQVHATLALTAASAPTARVASEIEAWQEATR